MKRNKKKALAVLCAVSSVGAVAALAACGTGNAEYVPDYDLSVGDIHEVDPEITLDGKLDDAIYKDRRWLEVNKEHGGETATMRMTSWFGKQGVYLAFDVTESCNIYVNHNRASYLNSGIEMYLASEGTTSIDTMNSFEVDLEADGTLTFKRRLKGGWDNFATTCEIMAQLVSTTKGGRVNTPDCYGYTHELFIPYDYMRWLGMLGEDETPNELYVNPVLISSYSYEGTRLNMDRHWFNTAADQLDGSGWGNPSQNYHFNKDGLVSHDIIINKTGDGGRVGERRGYNYAVDRNNVTLKVDIDEGHRLSVFKINGRDRRNDISNGLITLPLVTSDIVVDATFEKIPEDRGKISGTVEYTGDDSAFLDDIDVYISDGFNSYRAEINRQTGSYEAYVPRGRYNVSVVSATGGYTAAQIERTLVSSDVTANFEIDDTQYGANRTLYMNDVVLSGGETDISSFGEPLASQQFVYSMFMGLADGAKNISSIDKLVTEQWLYCGEAYTRFQLMNWEGLYYLKLLYYDASNREQKVDVQLTGAVKDILFEQNGLYLAIVRDGDKISVAYLNRSGNWVNLITKAELYPFASGAKLSRIKLAGAEGISGEYPTAVYNSKIVSGTTDPIAAPPVKVETDYDPSLVTLDGLENVYSIGSRVEFDANVQNGYAMKVLLNGNELESSGSGYAFTMLGRADLKFVTVVSDPRDLTIDIHGYRFGEYVDLDGAQVTLKGIKTHTATVDNGVLRIENIIPGEYEVSVPGYESKTVDLRNSDDVTLMFNMFANNSHWDIRGQNGKNPVIYAKDGGAQINSASEFDDFFIETTFKYNKRLAQKASSAGSDEYTQRKGYTITFSNGRTLQPSLNMHGVQFAPLESSTAVTGSDWGSIYNLSDAEIERYHGAEGIKFGLLRIGRYVTVTIDGKIVAEFTLQSEYDGLSAKIGLHQYNGAGLGKETYAYSFEDSITRDVAISESSVAEGCTIALDGAFEVGDDVKIKVTPKAQVAGERLVSIVVNNKERIADYSNGTLTIANCPNPTLDIRAKWAKPLLDITPVYGSWDFSKIDEGKVITDNSTHSKLSFGMFDDFMVRGVFKSEWYQENNVNRQEFMLQFPSSMQIISFGMVNGSKDSGAYVQGMDDQDGYSAPYKWWNFLDNGRLFDARERELYFGEEGLEMMLVRKGDKVHLFIDGKFERTITLDQITGAATAKVELCFKHWLDDASYVEIPLEADGEADKYLGTSRPEIDATLEHGSITANKTSYDPMNKESVTFTVTPDAGYKIASVEIGGKDVTDLLENGSYTLVGRPYKTYATARFVADTNVSTDKITFEAKDEKGSVITVPAGREFTFTNKANNIVYTATTTADGKLAFKRDGAAVTQVLALRYDVTSAYGNPFTVDVTAAGAELDISFRTVVVTSRAVTDNTRDVRLSAAVDLKPVLAYERWISEWDSAIDTVDPDKLLGGCKYWSVAGTETANERSGNKYGAITSASGYSIYGLPGQDAYKDWAPVIKRATDSAVVVRKDVTRLRVFAGKWWGENRDITFTLKCGDAVYATRTVTMGQNNGHAIVEFDFDTSDMATGAKLEFTLNISSSGNDGYAIAGLQLLGRL